MAEADHQPAPEPEPTPPEPEPEPAPPEPAPPRPGSSPAAAPARRTRRQLPESTKRLLFIIGGGFVLVASVMGFYLTSDAFDDRAPVLVAARPISVGETLSTADFASDLVIAGSIPHEPWTPDAPLVFDGMVAVVPIPAGALVRPDMFIEAETAPVGVELEVIVPLDLSLVTDEVSEGELVLLVDPGVEPALGDQGRPRRVVRQFKLTNFDGAQMRLFLPPEEWAQWLGLLEAVGGTLMVEDLGLGAEPEETIQRLDAVWSEQWSEVVQEIALAAPEAEPRAGPGELEVIVSLDASLAPSGVADGDLVLLIDPGKEPEGADVGRPRSVLQTLELQNYADGQIQMFVEPDEWMRWKVLPDALGGTPLVLPVAAGTDVDRLIERLDAEWEAAWQQAVVDAVNS